MTWVKVCGVCREKDVKLCSGIGVDALGFVTEYPDPVPWNLNRVEAKELVQKTSPFVSSVLVTTGSAKKIGNLAQTVESDIVQLHGREKLETVEKVVDHLHSDGMKVIKAFPLPEEADVEKLKSRIIEFQKLGIDGVTIDSKSEERSGGGTGKTVNWEKAGKIFKTLGVPTILAGGLNPDNIKEAIKIADPSGVDVISGVEKKSRVKDPEKVRKFIERAKDESEGGEFFGKNS